MDPQSTESASKTKAKRRDRRPSHITIAVPTPEATSGRYDGLTPPEHPTSEPPSNQSTETLVDDLDIPASERYGLPSSQAKSESKFQKWAAEIVAARGAALPTISRTSSADSLPGGTTPPAHSSNHGAPGVFSALMGYSKPSASHPTHQRPDHRKSDSAPYLIDQFRLETRKTIKEFKTTGKAAQNHVFGSLDSFRDPRRNLPASGSGAGTIGALQSSAFDLLAFASPRSATVRPDPERPGFHIARFLPDHLTCHDGVIHLADGWRSAIEMRQLEESHPGLSEHDRSISATGLDKELQRVKAEREGTESPGLASNGHILPPSGFHTPRKLGKHISSMLGPLPGSPLRSGQTTPEEKERPSKHRKRHKDSIYITMHVAAILERQEFIMLLARALMMFGGPTHRVEAQLEETARVLEIDCSIIYLVSFMLITFQDHATQTSSIRVIKQSSALDLSKLRTLGIIHYECMHDQLSVTEAAAQISALMKRKPLYGKALSILLGCLCSFAIGVPSFNASFVDILVAFPLGGIVIASQILLSGSARVLSSIFEIVIVAVMSFVASALSSSGFFCYGAVMSCSIVLLLPGWLICTASLELQTRSILSGSVRLVYAIIYSLFLGFGISIGSTLYTKITSAELIDPQDTTCSIAHSRRGHHWYLTTISPYFNFLFVPLYPICLSLKNQKKIWTKEFPATVFVAICGWLVNHFSALAFPGRSDLTSVLGAMTVGLLSSIYSYTFHGASFIVCITPIMFQLPSGLGNGGLLNFATSTENANETFSNLFGVAEQLLIVSLGLVLGLFLSGSALAAILRKKSSRARDLISF